MNDIAEMWTDRGEKRDKRRRDERERERERKRERERERREGKNFRVSGT
jgi:hypothetical protein